ncbi:cellulose binding domain-containing protein [Amycolatopsis anabasis]|uniref:cellulose binding domain-containing protein n=1 Tax=Amycolatopsis anabasis TaxID=1840409 RepID=UPI00131C415D|nr:cellulose binding domain-containing protein [Amycolatopsis anabasis]
MGRRFTAAVAVTNKRQRAALDVDVVRWPAVSHGWGGDYSHCGDRVTVTAADWNTTLALGKTVTTGFNGDFDHGDPPPGGLTLNGARCDAG